MKRRETIDEEKNGERRGSNERRKSPEDRRAFWRPTPDRRREDTELGRRVTDGASTPARDGSPRG